MALIPPSPEVAADFKGAAAAMRQAGRVLTGGDQKAFEQIGDFLGERVRENFTDLRPGLAVSTIEARVYRQRRGLTLAGSLTQPLVAGGGLRAAASASRPGVRGSRVQITPEGFTNTVVLPQARLLARGGRAGRGGRAIIPARDYETLTPEDFEEATEILAKRIAARFQGKG